jgi:hypothetical protein
MNEIDQIHAKLDKHTERQEQIILVLNEVKLDLNYHIRRTDILEAAVKEQADEINPIRRHVEVVNAVTKIFAALVAAGASIAAIIRLTLS